MLSNVKNVFKISDLRNKFLFLLAMIALYRLGVAIRVPGIDPEAVKQFKAGVQQQGALGFLDLFSGGAFGSFSIFALGIMPYITASIIMQVLGVVIPKLEALQKERLAQVERSLAQEADALRAEGDEQRVAVLRLREEVQVAAKEAIREATNELEQMAAERRRALHEVGERLRRRERELREQIEREEVDATQRLAGSFEEVERRQAERLAR